jgi:hypothetical protein
MIHHVPTIRVAGAELPLNAAATAIADELRRFEFRYEDEKDLQAGLYQVLHRITPTEAEVMAGVDRFDFKCGPIVVECKVKGSESAAISQCGRYLKRPDVEAIILVGPAKWTLAAEAKLLGKPFRFVRARRRSF